VTLRTLLSTARAEIGYWLRDEWSFEEVGRHWDRTEDYDEVNQGTYSYFRRFTDGLRLARLPGAGTTLDLCARTGLGTKFFFEEGKIARAVCADVSMRMGRICAERMRQSGLGSWMWVPIADYRLPFREHTFDTILCFETVEHFARPAELLMDIGRVTRSGGVLILTTPNLLWEPIHAIAAILGLHHSEGPHRFLRLAQLKLLVEAAGFRIQRLETTVLVPGGPPLLVRLGEWLERRTRRTLMPLLGLRRVIFATRR